MNKHARLGFGVHRRDFRVYFGLTDVAAVALSDVASEPPQFLLSQLTSLESRVVLKGSLRATTTSGNQPLTMETSFWSAPLTKYFV